MKCLYTGNCQLEGTQECGLSCVRRREMQFMLDKSMIPPNRQRPIHMTPPDADVKEYRDLIQIASKIKEAVDYGSNIVLYSENTGNGKTTWAIRLMLNYFNQMWAGNGFTVRGYFIHVPTFLNRVKASINNPDEELTEIQNNINTVDLVILDDLGTSKMSEYDNSLITSIIDQRVLNGKSTIVTTNCTYDKMIEAVGKRVTDRIWNTGTVFHFKGGSRRGM